MVKQLLVSGSVDFLTQNLGSAGNSQLSNLISQGVTGRLNFLSSLSTSSGDNLIGLNLCLSFCFFNNGLATLFACSRLYNNRHWVADVVAGAGFGILSVELAYLTYFPIRNAIARRINLKASDRLVIAPTLSPEGGGLYLSWKF